MRLAAVAAGVSITSVLFAVAAGVRVLSGGAGVILAAILILGRVCVAATGGAELVLVANLTLKLVGIAVTIYAILVLVAILLPDRVAGHVLLAGASVLRPCCPSAGSAAPSPAGAASQPGVRPGLAISSR
jgi:hypothetical protein